MRMLRLGGSLIAAVLLASPTPMTLLVIGREAEGLRRIRITIMTSPTRSWTTPRTT